MKYVITGLSKEHDGKVIELEEYNEETCPYGTFISEMRSIFTSMEVVSALYTRAFTVKVMTGNNNSLYTHVWYGDRAFTKPVLDFLLSQTSATEDELDDLVFKLKEFE